MDKKFIVFIVISGAILYLSNYFMVKNIKKPVKSPEMYKEEIVNDKKEVIEQKNSEVLVKNEQNIKEITNIDFKNELFDVRATSLGAKLDKLVVKRAGFNESINLVDNLTRNNNFIFNVILNGTDLGLDKQVWNLSNQPNGLEFFCEPSKNIFIKKEIIVQEGKYVGELNIEIDNQTDATLELTNARLSLGPVVNSAQDKANIKQIVILNNGKIERIKSKKKNEKLIFSIENGWAAIREQYFCTILYADKGIITSAEAIRNEDQTIELNIVLPPSSIPAKTNKVYRINTYIGPQDYQEMKKIGNNLQKIVDFGTFQFIAVPIYYLLKYLFNITKNYGIAIILLTLIIRIILWWPTQKSYTSMKKMQTAMNKMQPRLKTLKEIYCDNPQKLNEETMKLYKEYQINPMGGCLPMLLQMPIFFALYAALSSAVELKGAEFMWVWKDLSAKDPVYVLPIIMGLTMFIQQKMSSPPAATPEAAAQQKMMLYMMPIMLTFFAFIWPSGLLLYWVVSNILSIGQQIIINRTE